MARTVKMTFTLDKETADRIDRTAERFGMPKSGVVREAVAEYAQRAGRLSENERLRLLKVFDEVVGQIPKGPARPVDLEITNIRRARQQGGRRSATNSKT